MEARWICGIVRLAAYRVVDYRRVLSQRVLAMANLYRIMQRQAKNESWHTAVEVSALSKVH